VNSFPSANNRNAASYYTSGIFYGNNYKNPLKEGECTMTNKGWNIIIEANINIIPVDDLYYHSESVDCSCQPKINIENNIMIITHNSYDKREIIEQLIGNTLECIN